MLTQSQGQGIYAMGLEDATVGGGAEGGGWGKWMVDGG